MIMLNGPYTWCKPTVCMLGTSTTSKYHPRSATNLSVTRSCTTRDQKIACSLQTWVSTKTVDLTAEAFFLFFSNVGEEKSRPLWPRETGRHLCGHGLSRRSPGVRTLVETEVKVWYLIKNDLDNSVTLPPPALPHQSLRGSTTEYVPVGSVLYYSVFFMVVKVRDFLPIFFRKIRDW